MWKVESGKLKEKRNKRQEPGTRKQDKKNVGKPETWV